MASCVYEELIGLVPKRTLRDAIVRQFIAFLRQSSMEAENPPEWFLEANRLLHVEDVEKELRASGDLTMKL
jgi:hypothetical protein